jgi:hypothetical protein
MLDGLWRLPVLKRLKGKLRLRIHLGGTQSVYKLSLKNIARVDNQGLRHQRYSRCSWCSQFELGLNDNPSGAALSLLHLAAVLCWCPLPTCVLAATAKNREIRGQNLQGEAHHQRTREVGWASLICTSRCAPVFGLDVELCRQTCR